MDIVDFILTPWHEQYSVNIHGTFLKADGQLNEADRTG
jgi:hypothetical protein